VALASLQNEGKTVMVVRRDERPIGLLAVSDEVRPEAHSMIRRLSAMKIGVVMLTGDHRKTADYIAHKLGIDRVEADLLPTDKVAAIERSRAASGRIAMVGDGVNDAPALANADIGIAMGAAGSDVALETADLVLMGDRLELIPYAIQLSRKARRVVWQNITFSLAVIVVLVISTFALDLALTTGVFGHEGSTVIVVTNGLLQLLILPEITRRRASRV
jgi:Cd2+/Zn2+-exporting ATPase